MTSLKDASLNTRFNLYIQGLDLQLTYTDENLKMITRSIPEYYKDVTEKYLWHPGYMSLKELLLLHEKGKKTFYHANICRIFAHVISINIPVMFVVTTAQNHEWTNRFTNLEQSRKFDKVVDMLKTYGVHKSMGDLNRDNDSVLQSHESLNEAVGEVLIEILTLYAKSQSAPVV